LIGPAVVFKITLMGEKLCLITKIQNAMKTINKIIPITLGYIIPLIAGCNKELPVASFNCPNTVGIGDTVYFQNTSEGANTFGWDFGDGTGSTEENPSHFYTERDSYTILLVATNEDGSDETSRDILITPWGTRALMPTARLGMGAAVVDGKVYVIGGFKDETSILDVVEVYDPVANSWNTKTPMPTARGGFGCAVVDGKIYAIGGTECGVVHLSIVEVYDPATDSWDNSTIIPMPTARNGAAACTVNGKIYVIGGTCQTGSLAWAGISTVEEYDPATNTWTTKQNKPTPGWGLRACVLEGKIYVTGGNVQYPNISAVLEVYDPVKDEWEIKASMPEAKYSHSICALNERIYSFGGWDNCATGPFYKKVEVYNPTTDIWTQGSDIPLTLGELSAVAVGNKIYIMGGTNTLHPFTRVSNVYEYMYEYEAL